jgi:hypothetical protein
VQSASCAQLTHWPISGTVVGVWRKKLTEQPLRLSLAVRRLRYEYRTHDDSAKAVGRKPQRGRAVIIVKSRFSNLCRQAFVLCLTGVAMLWGQVADADIGRFVGSYSGSAEVVSKDGTATPRDMSVVIDEKGKDGFTVQWTSTTYRPDSSAKTKSYSIDFVPSDRDNVYSAAMQRNVFGHQVQMDPMKGEPYVWARIIGDTLTVYSLFVDANGGYELQQFDRRLVDGGLLLDFERLRNGERQATVSTFLKRN